MEVQVLQSSLVQAVAKVRPFAVPKHTLPSIRGLRLRVEGTSFTITATDLDTWAQVEVGCRVVGDSDGAVVVEAASFAKVVTTLPKALLSLEGNKDGLRISWAGGSATIPYLCPPDDFPPLPKEWEGENGSEIMIKAQEFRQAVTQVSICAATSDNRPVLRAINWRSSIESTGSCLTLAATDGFRLAVKDVPYLGQYDRDTQVNLPAVALQKLARVLGSKEENFIRVHPGKAMAWFSVPHFRAGVRYMLGSFPNYPLLIPAIGVEVRVVRVDLLACLKRVAEVARQGSGIIRLVKQGELLTVSAVVDDAHLEEKLEATGDATKTAANGRYLVDALSVMQGDVVTLMIPDTIHPFMISDTGGLRHTIMPMFVQWGSE